MTTELFWLTLTVLMTALIWVPYILDRMAKRGLMQTMANPRPDMPAQSDWAVRMMAAHANAVENLVVFAPLVLTLKLLDISTGMTAAAAAVFFWARLIHLVVYTAGIPVARTLAFAVGWICQILLVIAIFQG